MLEGIGGRGDEWGGLGRVCWVEDERGMEG